MDIMIFVSDRLSLIGGSRCVLMIDLVGVNEMTFAVDTTCVATGTRVSFTCSAIDPRLNLGLVVLLKGLWIYP